MDILAAVVKFKQKFYHSAWAKYADAKPGTLKLLPSKDHRDELKRDYHAMESMLFGKVPDFEQVLRSLSDLESEINGTDGRLP